MSNCGVIYSLRDSAIVNAIIEGPGPFNKNYKICIGDLGILYLSCAGGYITPISRKEFDYFNRLFGEINSHGLPDSMRS